MGHTLDASQLRLFVDLKRASRSEWSRLNWWVPPHQPQTIPICVARSRQVHAKRPGGSNHHRRKVQMPSRVGSQRMVLSPELVLRYIDGSCHMLTARRALSRGAKRLTVPGLDPKITMVPGGNQQQIRANLHP